MEREDEKLRRNRIGTVEEKKSRERRGGAGRAFAARASSMRAATL